MDKKVQTSGTNLLNVCACAAFDCNIDNRKTDMNEMSIIHGRSGVRLSESQLKLIRFNGIMYLVA
jgi:hypothetical protein